MNAVVESADEGRPPANVLLVDDKPENLLALEAVLRPLGHNLVTATSGEEALKLVLKHDFAVILLDVQMPGLDGFETASYIKQTEKTRHIPIIFLTAISKEASHVFRGYSVGAVDYVLKPFDPTVLRSKVSVFVELHEKQAALAESEDRFRKAFESAPIGVALVDRDGRWLRVNRALCDMLGYTDAQLLSTTVDEVAHPAEAEFDLVGLSESLRFDPRAHLEKRFVHRDGGVVHTLVSVSQVIAGQARVPYFIFQINDISERKALEAFRERFIANAAHELRTPVSVLTGTAGLLANADNLPKEQFDRLLGMLVRQSKRLTGLVNSLLDLTTLQEGRFVAEPESILLKPFVEEIVESTPPPQGRSVDVSIAEEAVVFVDRRGLDQMLTNLIVNAYRYGGANIRVASTTEDRRITIEVADDGPGIPVDLVPKLFNPFTRGREASEAGGAGLGLALVRNLAQACGGEIKYLPNMPRGSRFTLSLNRPE